MINEDLSFTTSCIGHTYDVGYLLRPDDHYSIKEDTMIINNPLALINFRELIGRLYTLSGQEIFDNADQYNASFLVTGFYKGCRFNLSDHKGDRAIHISSTDELTDLPGLIAILTSALSETAPKPYIADSIYDHFTFKL